MLADKLRASAFSELPLPVFVSSRTNTGTGSSTTVTAPSGIQDGDLLVACVFHGATNILAIGATGWDIVFDNFSGTNNRVSIFVKTASSESGNYTFTFGVSAAHAISVLVYRNATNINTLGAVTKTISATGSASSITPTRKGVLCAMFGNEAAVSVSTAPSGMTQRALSTTNARIAVYEKSPQAAEATGSVSLVWSGSGSVASIQFQITNEPPVAPEFIASTYVRLSGSFNLSKPAGTLQNDLMVMVLSAYDGGVPSLPSGWTQVLTHNWLRIGYKVAGASEPSSYAITGTGAVAAHIILTYRHAAYQTVNTVNTSVSGNPTVALNSATSSSSQSMLVAVLTAGQAGITRPTGMTQVLYTGTFEATVMIAGQVAPKGETGQRVVVVNANTAVAAVVLNPTR